MHIALISPYEIGRQPFGLAAPAALLKQRNFTVHCVDLSVQSLDDAPLGEARLVALYLAMHTATRLAIAALPRIRRAAPRATLCAYGLYAPMNAALLDELGVSHVLGGEFEGELVALAEGIRSGDGHQAGATLKVSFLPPARETLPPLTRYAHLILPHGDTKTVGFAETTRGCKHMCRHCPVVPVYEGKFHTIPREVVLEDIRRQVSAGAAHISFGDPDFFNGPGHGLRVVRAMHEEFPTLTFDATIKIEHLLNHAALLPELKTHGCLFITSAVEAVDDRILEHLDKGHTRADFITAVATLAAADIALAPTFVAFTPWITVGGYLDLLRQVVALHLVESIPPVQWSIRLLIPRGSHLFRIPGFAELVDEFDPATLGYPWRHQAPEVDALQRAVQACVEAATADDSSRAEIFTRIWRIAHDAAGECPPPLEQADFGAPIPRLSENWYCCAEPTEAQLLAV